jgi:hypothetical protein
MTSDSETWAASEEETMIARKAWAGIRVLIMCLIDEAPVFRVER